MQRPSVKAMKISASYSSWDLLKLEGNPPDNYRENVTGKLQRAKR